jgi:NAD(P)-dependent dehydrogenase (short-subunit alcohol dehydrogenase family)
MVCNVGGPGNCLGPVHETDPDAFDHALRLLMTSGFLGIRAAGRHMLAHHKQGAIVTIASVAGELGGPGPSVYGAGKAGLIQLTLNAAADLAPHGIRVNCISPGVALTEMLRATGKDEAFAEKLQPLPIAGLPERIGAAVVFLCSGAASVVAGANLRVDGAALAAGIDLRQKLGF